MQKRFQNVVLMLVAYIYQCFRGQANQKPKLAPASFIVINPTTNIGDMVCTTPVFRAIKERYPSAKLVVVGTSKNAQMMENNQDIDKYIILKKSFLKTVYAIRAEKCEAGIVINPSTVDFMMLFLGGVQSISNFILSPNFRHREPRIYRRVSKLGHQVEYTPGEYVPGQYLKLLGSFGIISRDIRKHLGYTSNAKDCVLQHIRQSGISDGVKIVAIAPGAGTKVKQWPGERFGMVANYLSKTHGVATVIIGGPGDLKESQAMIDALDTDARYCNCVGQSLDELKATLAQVFLVIGNDSAPIYIAESFGASTIVLVGPTDEAEHPLQDETHRVVLSRRKGEALLQSCVSGEDSIDMQQARAQIEAISVEQVCSEVDDVLRKLKFDTKN